MYGNDPDWADMFQRHCKARLPKSESPQFYGRCELERGHSGDHALERGLIIVKFSFSVHIEHSDMGELVVRNAIKKKNEEEFKKEMYDEDRKIANKKIYEDIKRYYEDD